MKGCSIKCIQKKAMGLLLALVMLVGMIPMTAFAEAGDWDWDLTTDVSEISSKDIRTGISNTASTTKWLGEGDVQLKVMPTLTSGNTTYNAMAYCGVKVTSSNPDVAELKEGSISIGKWEGGSFDGADALQAAVTPKSVGTTVVTFTFYYTFSQTTNPSPYKNPNAVWFKGQNRYTVNVKEGKPDGPTEADAKRFRNIVNTTSGSKGAVYIWCSANLYDHGAWFDYLTDVPNGYSFGEVVKNDGSNKNMPASSYPWMCVMTVDHKAYLNAYNEEIGDEVGKHYLEDPETLTTKVSWFYDADNEKWTCQASNAPVYINVVHNKTSYTVTYTDGVNGEAFADQVYSDLLPKSATPTFEGGTPTREGYVFKGWDPAVADEVTDDATYTATWSEDKNGNGVADDEEDKYTVTYTDGVADEVIFEDQVYSGLLSGTATPAFEGGTPTREGYVFKGWDPAVADEVTENATYTAIWSEDKNGNGVADDEEDKYTVTYTDGVAGEVVFEDQVYSGLLSGTATPAFEGGTPTRKGYVFSGWNPEVAGTVTGNATYTATWKEDKDNGDDKTTYTVTYKDGADGKVFADQIHSGLKLGDATPAFESGTPTREGYVFKGWSPEVTKTVLGDATYTAIWEKDKSNNGDDKKTTYTVTYTDGVNGEAFENQVYSDLTSGSVTPAFDGTPTRTGYVFKGWNPEVAETVTGDITYTATWAEDKNNNGIADDEEKPTDTKPADTKPGAITKPTDTKSDDTNKTNKTNKLTNAKMSEKTKSATTSPQTGDTNNMFLWLALIFVSGGAVVGTTVVSRKRKFNR